MKYNKTSFPIQKLKMSQKNEEWQQASIDYIIGMGEVVSGGMTRSRFEELQVYYNLYNSIFDEKDLKAVTNPFKVDDGFPATPQDYNIIRPKIDLLVGEETKRPFNFRVVRTSSEATSELQEKTKQMVLNYVMAAITARMSPEESIDFQQKIESGEVMPPEAISKYMQRSYKDILENVAYHSLNYLRQKLNTDHEFIRGWKDALIAGEEVYYVGIQNGEPMMERVNPLFFSFDKSPDLEFIEDGDWCCRRMRLAYTEVYDRFFDKMTEKQLNQLLDAIEQSPTSYGADKNMIDDFNHIKLRIVDNPTYDFRARNTVNVWHACWKSFKRIAFVTYRDENGDIQQTIVDENYTENGTEIDVTWDWIIEVWEGYRIGTGDDSIYVGCQPIEYQHVSIDNPNSQKLPYCGVVYSNTNSIPRSLVSIMKPLQYMYIVLWYRLELALARDKGKVINMDITQIPKSMNIDPAKWMHYLSAIGVNFINPYEEGWDIPGREGGKPATFNQITSLDLTMANVIDQYINLMSKIEQLAGELSGVSPQRQGAISSNELVGNVERSVVQSSHITEPLFWMHNQCKRRVFNMLLNTAKGAWEESGKTKLHYIFDDVERAFLDIDPKFYYEDFDIFCTDSSKDSQNMEVMKSLIQPAMQNGASLLDAVEILTSDNLSVMKNRLKDIIAKQESMAQQQQQQELEQQQAALEAENEIEQQKLANEERKLDLEKYKIDQDNATKISVAQINAYRYTEDMDQDNNGIVDVIEIGKQAIEQQKNIDAKYLKENEFKIKKEIEERKASIEEKKIKAAKELQKQKDAAAMEREKLKAKTALKNKVVGEHNKKK